MLKLMMSFLMLHTLVGCGPVPKGRGWSIAFDPYMTAFQAEAENHGKYIDSSNLYALSVEFGDAAGHSNNKFAIGCCNTYNDGSRTITIEQSWWYSESTNEGDRYELVFHELGHCLMDYKHRSGKDAHGHPASIMNPQSFDGVWFQTHINDYMNEFFSGD